MKCELCQVFPYLLRILLRINYESDADKYIQQLGIDDVGLGQGTGKQEVKSHPWSYEGSTGPAHWGEKYPICNGNRQSPVNIMTSEVQPVTWLSPFEFVGFDQISGHRSQTFLRLRNNGHTASMAVEDEMYIQGANLGDRYRTAEMHFHWGQDNQQGSEHGIDNYHHPLEIHFVHYNIRYGNLSEAMKHPDGLAVIGVFADISREHNLAFEHISESLDKVTEYNSKTAVTGIRPMDLLPRNTNNFYHYEGSLTTPPCYESVLWFVMEDKIKVSDGQLRRLRHLKEHVDEKHAPHPAEPSGKEATNSSQNGSGDAPINHSASTAINVKYITENFRPIQSLNGRTIYCSHASMRITTGGNQNVVKEKPLQKPEVRKQEMVIQGDAGRVNNEISQPGGADAGGQVNQGVSFAQDIQSSNNLIPNQNIQNVVNIEAKNGNWNTPRETAAGSLATRSKQSHGTPTVITIDFNGQGATDIQGKTKSGSAVVQDFGFGLGGSGNEVMYGNPEAETNQEEIGDYQNEEVFVPSKNYGGYGAKRKHYDSGPYLNDRSKSTTKSGSYGGSSKNSQKFGFTGQDTQQTNSATDFGTGNQALQSLMESSQRLATASGSTNPGGDTMKKANLLKAFANIFLKQADILQRMQEQKHRRSEQSPTFLLSDINNNVASLSTKEFSNPLTGFVSQADPGISGFGQQRIFNGQQIEFPKTNIGIIDRPQMAAFEAVPVSIETPSWKSPSLTKFSQTPKDFIQRQHLTYYDPLDRPANHRTVLSAPAPKYNIINPPPQWPLNIAPTLRTKLPPTPKVDAYLSKTQKKRRAPRRKRRWLIDLLSDYAKLMKKLQK